jgi:hypothetical protein
MDRKTAIHDHLIAASNELLGFIRERMAHSPEGWVPASEIKRSLALNFVAVPRGGKQHGEKGWIFAILARMLEDRGLLEYKKTGSRAFYRAVTEESYSDAVRNYCEQKYVVPARKRGEKQVSIRAGDVHKAMQYQNRFPLVCSALGAAMFEAMSRVRRTAIEGPINGANTVFHFHVLP